MRYIIYMIDIREMLYDELVILFYSCILSIYNKIYVIGLNEVELDQHNVIFNSLESVIINHFDMNVSEMKDFPYLSLVK